MEKGSFSCNIKAGVITKDVIWLILLVDRVRSVTQWTGSSYKGSVSEDGKFSTSFYFLSLIL